MAKKERVFTAPLAVIQINSVTVGKMKNVRITENITINFNLLANKLKKGTFRNAGTIEEWANAILMQEDGLEIAILKKVKDGEIDLETGLVKTKYETFAKVSGAFATREGFDVQEGQISGRDTEFEYTDPILYNDIA